MTQKQLYESLENNPIIAAVHEPALEQALSSPADVIFLLGCPLIRIPDRIAEAKQRGKAVFLHLDLSEGVGKDRGGIEYIKWIGADGIVSTRPALIRMAKEAGMLTVQRFFVYDSQGVGGISEVLESTRPDLVEIMPGVIEKMIRRFSSQSIPLIAGGLIETKEEVTGAIRAGAFAVSTGKQELWYV